MPSDAGGSTANAQGKPYFFALVVIITDEIGWEYPDRVTDLAGHLSLAGYPRDELLGDLTLINRANQVLQHRGGSATEVDPVVMFVGTRSRWVAGDKRLAHLVARKLDEVGQDVGVLKLHHVLCRRTADLMRFLSMVTSSVDLESGGVPAAWAEVFVDGGRRDPVPAVAQKESEAARPSQEEVDSR